MSDPEKPQFSGAGEGPGQPRPPIDPTGTSAPPPPPPGYVPAVYVQHPSAKSGATKIIMYVLAVGLLISLVLNVYLSGPLSAIAEALAGGIQEERINPEVEVTGDTNRVVVVEITGTIDAAMAAYASNAFYQLTEDPPGAVVLRVESGGGGVKASDQIWHALTQFRKAHPDVPVITSFGTVAASGGYYVSAPADYIFCERTGITGSIGVLAQLPAAGGMIEKLGLEMNMVIASQSPNKDDANNLFTSWYTKDNQDKSQGHVTVNGEKRFLTADGAAGRSVLENLVDSAYVTFADVVVKGRTAANSKITKAQLEPAMTGKIFVGKAAVKAKLVDKIGYLDDAITYAAKQAKLDEGYAIYAISQDEPFSLFSLMGRRSGKGLDLTDITASDLHNLYDDATAVRLEYKMRIR